jgi:hypothetical protein
MVWTSLVGIVPIAGRSLKNMRMNTNMHSVTNLWSVKLRETWNPVRTAIVIAA